MIFAVFVAISLAPTAFALTADELLLVVNRNVPEGRQLAELYAKTRGVPSDRIVELDLPNVEEIPFDTYERDVVPPIRAFLRGHQLEAKVNCLVTFWGMPLKVAGRVNTLADDQEVKSLRDEVAPLMRRAEGFADRAEALAKQANLQYKPFDPPRNAAPVAILQARLETSTQSLSLSIQRQTDPAVRQALLDQVLALSKEINSPAVPATNPTTAPAVSTAETAMGLVEQHYLPSARAKLRELRRTQPMFVDLQLLTVQMDYLTTEQTDAALDNEPALLWWPNYTRKQWQLNPFYYRVGPIQPGLPKTVMVSRLDAPDLTITRRLIEEPIRIEQSGLTGGAVVDARGIPLLGKNGAVDNYGVYDDKLRILAAFLKDKPKIKLTFDNRPDVLPANSCKDVAVYYGWYSVGNYVPTCALNPGAVAAHIASFELITLHARGARGWVPNLLRDGADATFGPVSEPYLHAFPAPDDFVPLLLTGKLTLAEVYWRTCPLASWKMALIGDPLYTPYKANPVLQVRELPPQLQPIVEGAPALPIKND